MTEMANEGENGLTVAVRNILEWDCLPVGHIEYVRWMRCIPKARWNKSLILISLIIRVFIDRSDYIVRPKEYIEDISVRTTADDKGWDGTL